VNIPFLDLEAATAECRPELDAAIGRVLSSNRFILGSELEEFEHAFADYCGAQHCIGVGNGLDALTLLLRAHGIGSGDEVIVPAFTFIATWLGVSQAGAKPTPAPVRADTANLDLHRIEEAITPRTAAVMAVHLYGQPAEMSELRALCNRRGLLLLEDAAQAHGARWEGDRAGGLGDGAAFSFYPGKNLGALGDAGAITVDDTAVADRCRALRNYGSARKYVHDMAGVNSRLDELQAAVLRVKLARLDEFNARRRVVATRYNAALSAVDRPTVANGAEPVWHLYVIRSPMRDRLQAELAARGVETLIHYPIAPHQSGAYRHLTLEPEHVASAARLATEVLSLPIGPHLGPTAVDQILTAVQDAAGELPHG
jgi:dTDP-4-amino-4,6-dideoxygalactose transaminase